MYSMTLLVSKGQWAPGGGGRVGGGGQCWKEVMAPSAFIIQTRLESTQHRGSSHCGFVLLSRHF